MDVLITVDEAYLSPVRTLLYSLRVNNPREEVRVFLMSAALPAPAVAALRRDLACLGCELVCVEVEAGLFANAPVSARYPREMYFRLLAPHLLPRDCTRVLYMDPDTLVINPLRPLLDANLQGKAFAAAAHTQKTELAHRVNQVRLSTCTRYLNSGVLLMDVPRARRCVDTQALFSYVSEHGSTLLLPDQDVFNALYGEATHEVDDLLWNYDAHNFNTYLLRSKGEATVGWVMRNTSILHFCGRPKPWGSYYRYRFGALYRHYQARATRVCEEGEGA